MAYEVIVSQHAERDLQAIFEFISRDSSAAAYEFVALLVKETKLLKTFPDRGGKFNQRPDVRFTVVGRYLVVYRVNESKNEVRVLRYWHSARERPDRL